MTDADPQALIDGARARLTAAGVPRERLGALTTPRRLFGIGRAARIRPAGEAWHLGVLLLTGDGLAATGEILRARHEAVRGVTAVSQRRRAELAAAARRGGFAEGEIVHLGWRPIALGRSSGSDASAPLIVTPQGVSVRWSPSGTPVLLSRYLDERVALLVDPPRGATGP